MGRDFKRCSVMKFPVSLRTAAEATQICFCFSGRYFLSHIDNSTTKAGLFQADLPPNIIPKGHRITHY